MRVKVLLLSCGVAKSVSAILLQPGARQRCACGHILIVFFKGKQAICEQASPAIQVECPHTMLPSFLAATQGLREVAENV